MMASKAVYIFTNCPRAMCGSVWSAAFLTAGIKRTQIFVTDINWRNKKRRASPEGTLKPLQGTECLL